MKMKNDQKSYKFVMLLQVCLNQLCCLKIHQSDMIHHDLKV